ADRGHRRAIFTPDYTFVGSAIGYHREYGIVCVQNFAVSYAEGGAAKPATRVTDKAPAKKSTRNR
ncbi:MAG TPA: hypothetical protein VEC36_06210, partial [Patescibacteria group bacterium]|nr:hypothetical protein [Patescibacteria group bacterium]